jgi:NADH dehydrogenase FAD-containing subunit
MKKILILGGGITDLIVANKLARELRNKIAKNEIEIIILDKSNTAINKQVLFLFHLDLIGKDLIRDKKSLVSP